VSTIGESRLGPVPPQPRQPVNVWVLPGGQAYQVGDVIAFDKTGHRLLPMTPKVMRHGAKFSTLRWRSIHKTMSVSGQCRWSSG